jgi:transcriptional regulator with XRE-family HTH domain
MTTTNLWHAKIKRAILLKNISLQFIAKHLGCSHGAVSKWLSGANQPDYDTLLTLCSLADLDVGFVLNDSLPVEGASAIRQTLNIEIERIGERESLRILLNSETTQTKKSEVAKVIRSRDETHLEKNLPESKRNHKRPNAPGSPVSIENSIEPNASPCEDDAQFNNLPITETKMP